MRDVTFTIPALLPSWNEFLAKSGWKYSRAVTDWTMWTAVAIQASGLGGLTMPCQVHIVVTRYGPGLVDVDNIMDKLPIDGMRKAGLLKDDDPKHVKSVRTFSELEPNRGEARVEIQLIPINL